ncbi:RHS repeat-associated core domain-containing protein [Chitinophaga nivalis]|uniref:RHS repeat-associated core domain-containing protein n=1 Tax=Chitinophaga nivalis TaxID=2991709 RepID=A0ABT3IJ93_9BACT|nr:RHS repeat-associated core domain-containing protein [Chitinophaga nivalis]MCW3466429.1 RHS repeat-associated core domain-containing protein [Chitinophaga nivalis]MCW3483880.1 RHS repeat-associated core domain-containing protein [Chitinophaga nivalis]
MKSYRFIIIIFLTLLLRSAYSQVSTQHNFIHVTTVHSQGITNKSQVDALPPEKSNKSVSYFDGLGRLQQSTVIQNSPGKKDIIAPLEYDVYGRVVKQRLPYADLSATAPGSFRAGTYADQATFFSPANSTNPDVVKDNFPFEQQQLEFSPLNRSVEKGATGQTWQPGSGHTIKTGYAVNTAADAVKRWSIGYNADALPTSGNYQEGELYKNITTDEHGKQLIEFTDKEGKLILRKIQWANSPVNPHTDYLCTYYVYDDFNNLRFVIPPKAAAALSGTWSFNGLADVAAELCFSMEYDERGRLIRKKIPGAGLQEMVYDVRDRLVCSQDGNLKAKEQWLTRFYDSQNRITMTALYQSKATRAALQADLNTTPITAAIDFIFPGIADLVIATYNQEDKFEATNSVTFENGFDAGSPATFTADINPTLTAGTTTTNATATLTIDPKDLTPLTYTFYDHYNYTGALPLEPADLTKLQPGASTTAETVTTYSSMTHGMVTGTKRRILGTTQFLTSSIYYDDKGRQIQTVSDNINNGKDMISYLYDFEGKIISTYTHRKNPRSSTSPDTRVLTVFGFDHGSRPISIARQVNDAGTLKTTTQLRYNALGQLRTKILGNHLDSLVFDYNIRGWLLGANRNYVKTAAGNYFGYELGYDQATSIIAATNYTKPQFNGNISGAAWRSKGDPVARKYDFTYDNINRLTAADFNQQNTGTTAWSKTPTDFSVSGLTYDQNGNILSLQQKGLKGAGSQTIDSLKYGYIPNSNKLFFVTDRRNDPQSTLGDFKETANNESQDYAYDPNGNLKFDMNKQLAINNYNYLNLPDSITLLSKGYIEYTYDATGNKLRKKVTDVTGAGSVTITDYLEDCVFVKDTLQFIQTAEGRIRPVYKTGQPLSFVYDYFETDHLGNVRLVLTEQTDFTMYAATMETNQAATENQLFSNIEETRVEKPAGYPQDETTPENTSVARLQAKAGGKKIGPSLVLRVMAGDTIQIGVKAFYKSQDPVQQNEPIPAAVMLTDLIQTFGGASGENTQHGEAPSLNNTPFTLDFYNDQYQTLKETATDQHQQHQPKAYLNFVLFDDQFKLVASNSGVRQVKGTPDELQTLVVDKMPISKNGFLYVYTSNEAPQDIYFDNLIVGRVPSPVLEETHYYPFGLTMAGISSNALKGKNYPENQFKYNGQELQHKEFKDGTGLEMYDFGARMYDQQIGRWHNIDPLSDSSRKWSPYSYALNNPLKFIDENGKLPGLPPGSWFPGTFSGMKSFLKAALYATAATVAAPMNVYSYAEYTGNARDPQVKAAYSYKGKEALAETLINAAIGYAGNEIVAGLKGARNPVLAPTRVNPFSEGMAPKAKGDLGEALTKGVLEKQYPNAEILEQVQIKMDGAKMIADFVVIKERKVIGVFESKVDKSNLSNAQKLFYTDGDKGILTGTNAGEFVGKTIDPSKVKTTIFRWDSKTGLLFKSN